MMRNRYILSKKNEEQVLDVLLAEYLPKKNLTMYSYVDNDGVIWL